MSNKPYTNICAVSKACEVLEPRWTLPILNVMWGGATRFNDIRRWVGWVSPGVLSKRLAEMEQNGLIERIEDRAKGTVDYVRTEKAVDLEEAMNALARWAQRNIQAEIALKNSNVGDMMWVVRASLDASKLPAKRTVIRFHFTDEEGSLALWWLVSEPGREIELCIDAPTPDVDLYVETNKFSLNAIYYGRSTVEREVAEGRMFLSGDQLLERTMQNWYPRSDYADIDGICQEGAH